MDTERRRRAEAVRAVRRPASGAVTYLRRHHVGLLALVVALSGTAYAATKIESGDIAKKAVKSKHVAANAVTAKHIKDGVVGTADVADGSLTPGDIADDSLTGADIQALGSGDIADDSLTGADIQALGSGDIADDSLTTADIDESTLLISRVVARLRDPTDYTVPAGFPPDSFGHLVGQLGPWTQKADETDDVLGRFTARLPSGCVADPAASPPGSRTVGIYLVRPEASFPHGLVAFGAALETAGGDRSVPGGIASFALFGSGDGGGLEPGSDVTRTLDVYAVANCDPSSTANPVIESIELNVIGHR